jgi:general transcription factor IIIA
LKAHEGRIHGGTRFFCTECPEPDEEKIEVVSYSTYTELQAHIRVDHPPTCSECSLVYSTPRELRRHIELAHGGLEVSERKIHLCTYPGCGRGFTKKGNLNVHIQTVHKGEKRFICGETDLSTSKKVEGWTGEGACGGKFGAKLSLEEHVRTAHMGLMNSRLEGKSRKEKEMIRQPKETRRRSLLSSLTGADYGPKSGRHIPCLVSGCAYMFFREYDLGLHMKALHRVPGRGIQDIFAEPPTDPINSGGILWTEYDRDMELDEERNPIVQDEAQQPYDGVMQLDDVQRLDGQYLRTRNELRPTEEEFAALVDPVLRYLQ